MSDLEDEAWEHTTPEDRPATPSSCDGNSDGDLSARDVKDSPIFGLMLSRALNDGRRSVGLPAESLSDGFGRHAGGASRTSKASIAPKQPGRRSTATGMRSSVSLGLSDAPDLPPPLTSDTLQSLCADDEDDDLFSEELGATAGSGASSRSGFSRKSALSPSGRASPKSNNNRTSTVSFFDEVEDSVLTSPAAKGGSSGRPAGGLLGAVMAARVKARVKHNTLGDPSVDLADAGRKTMGRQSTGKMSTGRMSMGGKTSVGGKMSMGGRMSQSMSGRLSRRGGGGSVAKKSQLSIAESGEEEIDAEAMAQALFEEEIAEREAKTIRRFRRHLSKFFGGPERAFQALDDNGDGDLSFEELQLAFTDKGLPEEDAEGAFDLRRLFYILDGDGSGDLSCEELMYSSFDELADMALRALRNEEDEPEDGDEGNGDDVDETGNELNATARRKSKLGSPGSTIGRRSVGGGDGASPGAADKKNPVPSNVLERFRRVLLWKYPTLAKAFKALDLDKKGQLSLDDLKRGLAKRGVELVDEAGKVDVQAVFKAVRATGDGGVTSTALQGKLPQRKNRPNSPDMPLGNEDPVQTEADKQMGFIDAFRRHLLSHFGNLNDAHEAFDINQNGHMSFSQMIMVADRNGLPECDAAGRYFDMRKIFYILDARSANYVSLQELLFTPRDELKEKILSRANMSMEAPALSDTVMTRNSVERFRRFISKLWGSADNAFKAMDTNENGELSMSEVTDAFDRKLITVKDELGAIDLRVVWMTLDTDGSGGITPWEWNGVWPIETPLSRGLSGTVDRGKKMKRNKSGKVGRRSVREADEPDTASSAALAKARERVREHFNRPCVDALDDDEAEKRPAGHSVSMKAIEDVPLDGAVDDLDLKHCIVGDWGAERAAASLVTGLDIGQHLRSINLTGNYIGDSGVARLARGLEQGCLVVRLLLSLNGIGDTGAMRLCRTIRKVTTLTELFLADNHIGNYGAKKLAHAIREKPVPALEVLDLQRNAIEQEGVQDLRQVAQGTHGIKCKVLSTQNIGERKLRPSIDLGTLWSMDPSYRIEHRRKPAVGVAQRKAAAAKAAEVLQISTGSVSGGEAQGAAPVAPVAINVTPSTSPSSPAPPASVGSPGGGAGAVAAPGVAARAAAHGLAVPTLTGVKPGSRPSPRTLRASPRQPAPASSKSAKATAQSPPSRASSAASTPALPPVTLAPKVEAKLLTVAMASIMTSDFGEAWGPSKMLRTRLDFARTVGEGIFQRPGALPNSASMPALGDPRHGAAGAGNQVAPANRSASRGGNPGGGRMRLGIAADL